MPHKTAAISAHVLCTPCNHTPVYSHFVRCHICRVPVCLAVTCHLHFWQNDKDLSRANAVTRGGADMEIRVSTEREKTKWVLFEDTIGSTITLQY